MKKLTFIRVNLSNVRVIIAVMRVPVEELLCQAVIGWIPVLKHLLSNARGCLWPYPIVQGIKGRCFPRTWLQRLYPVLESPQALLLGAHVRTKLDHEEDLHWANKC
jgi:hypothetical protein